MKITRVLLYLFCISLIVFIFQAFYPAPFPGNKENQLLAKANMYNLQFPQEKIYLHFDRPAYWANDDIWFKAYLLNSPIPDCNIYVELLNSAGKIIQKKMYWAQQGLAYGDLHVADTISSGIYQIRAYTNWMRNFDDCWFFRKNLAIWNLRDKIVGKESSFVNQKDIDLQFFPEGGTFVTNIKNKMAFIAVDKNGKGIDVAGKIVDDNGNEVVDFQSHFKGMGSFIIQPQVGRKYTAQVSIAGKTKMKIDLPVSQASGVTMTIDSNDKAIIHIQISDRSLTSESNPTSEYLMVGKTNGVVFYRKEITTVQGFSNFDIEKDVLPNGIIQFTLFDQNIVPRCERLVFINHKDFVTVDINPDKSDYVTREKVQLDVEAFNNGGMPCLTNLSISAYNPDNQLKTEDYPNNILSHFLICSELKGTIDDPSYYFKDDSISTILKLDNLMLTHGYRHFEWKEIIEDRVPEIVYPPEECIKIKGTVKTVIMEKPIPNCKVTLLFVKNKFGLNEQTTDSMGQFLFSDQYFNDTVYISLQALNQKNKRNTMFQLDEKSSISPKANFLPVNYQYVKDNQVNTTVHLSEVSGDLINKIWHLRDTILLGDINVVGSKVAKGDGHIRIYADADFVFDVSKHDDVMGNVFEMIDGRIPGVRYEALDNTFWIRGNTEPALLLLDGIPVDKELIKSLSISNFDKIEVVKFAPMLGSKGNNGAIFFYLKRGVQQKYIQKDAIGMKSSMIIGYSVIRKFYSPQYDSKPKSNEKKDFRSTLYWNPILRTDSTGIAQVSFYNSDQTGDVQVVVEGITADGKLCRGLCRYKVTQ